MSSQVVLSPSLTTRPPTLELLSVAPLAGSALVASGFLFSRLIAKHREKSVARRYSLTHVLINVLAILVVGSSSVLSALEAVSYPAKLAASISTAIWGVTLLLRLSYFLSSRHRRDFYLTANAFAFSNFVFYVFPNHLFPFCRVDGNQPTLHLPRLVIASITCSLLASVVIPLFTPFHYAPPTNGSRPHPSAICTPITRWWTYGWASPFILKAYRLHGKLNVDDLPPLMEGSDPASWSETFAEERLKTNTSTSALWSIFRLRLAGMAFLMILCGFAEFIGAIGLRSLLQHLEGSTGTMGFQPWFSVLMFGISPIVRGLCMQTFEFFSTQAICYFKALLIHTVYRKLLKQKPGSHPDIAQVTNHVAADVDKVTTIRYTIMAGFMVPVEVAVASVLLYQTIGWSYVPGLLTLLITRIPISWCISAFQGAAQTRVMAAIDARVRRVSETIKGLQTIKMLGQSPAFTGWIGEKREAELKAIWKKAIVTTISETISSAFVLVPLVMSLGTYTLGAGKPLTPAVVFTVVAIFNTLKQMLSLAVIGVSTYAQSMVSLKRVVEFLDDDAESLLVAYEEPLQIGEECFLGARQATIGVGKAECLEPVLNNVNFELVRGGLNIITGKTGSGKSTLLKGLLGEAPTIEGEISIRSHSAEVVSYAGQAPWLQGGSVRDNIIFSSPFSAKKYEDVVRAVNLDVDIQFLSSGDLTEVGESGSSLSGGQRARVALARAIYADTKTILLDDVLSALDSSTSKWIVDNCILGPLMKDRTVVLVTENPRLKEHADLEIELGDGSVKSLTKRADTWVEASESLENKSALSTLSGETLSVREGSVALEQDSEASVPPSKSGAETLMTGLIGRLYMLKYLRLFGSPAFLFLLCALILAAQASDVVSSLWLMRWSTSCGDSSTAPGTSGTVFYLLTYASIGVTQLSLITVASLIFFRGALSASRTEHLKMLMSVFGAAFTWITCTPAGQIMNRFSSDMFSLDNTVTELLKQVVENYLSIGFRLAAVSSMLPAFLLPAIAVLAVALYTGQVYLYGSTAAKRLYAASLSPLLSSISDAVSGIEVIRAHRVESAFNGHFLQSLERYLRAWEAVSASQRWLAVRMDFFAGAISLSTATLAVLSSSASPATIGFSMTSSTTLCTALLYVVYLSSLLEVEMNSFQRIEEYVHTVPREPRVVAGATADQDLMSWPSHGHLEVENLTAGYSLDSEPVLSGVDLDARPCQRIAIVGRSGSGKSSLVASVLRLATKFKGRVAIDGVDLDTVDAERLRRGVSFIPQNPTLFEGPLRFNLDFTGTIGDEVLQKVLDDVLRDTEKQWCLDKLITANGANLSQGERQLIAVARALVANTKIVIIDEATASLDEASDHRIQRLLRERLADRTLLAIAHRLATIIDFDMVLVMDKGQIVERGNPQQLVDSGRGEFWKLWNAMYRNNSPDESSS